jgi:hypothetical protein
MNTPNPFKPPEAAVADIVPTSMASRGPIIVLGIAGLIAIAWFASWLPGLVTLIDVNAMNPVIGFLLVVGEICLAIGLWRAVPSGRRGRRSFVLAIAFLALAVSRMGALESPIRLFLPFVLAMAVAAAGFLLVNARLRASHTPS